MLSLDVFKFALGITAPIFILLFIGTGLKRVGMINDEFVSVASKLVFNMTLPALLFINIVTADVHLGQSIKIVSFGVLATLTAWFVLEIVAARWVQPRADRGVVIQGSFRSNMGIIGLAYCVNAYGDSVYSIAAIYLAIVTIAYNILSVITLTRWLAPEDSNQGNLKPVFLGIAKNPLIIGICLALVITTLKIPVPQFVLQTGNYFAQMTLPLALLCAGASLNFKGMANTKNTVIAASAKLVIIPLLATLAAIYLGFRGMELGVIFLMTSAPAASVSYVMVRAMQGNATLAANIIVVTTLVSLLSTSLGAALLRAWGLS